MLFITLGGLFYYRFYCRSHRHAQRKAGEIYASDYNMELRQADAMSSRQSCPLEEAGDPILIGIEPVIHAEIDVKYYENTLE
jgi:hypothetical protein